MVRTEVNNAMSVVREEGKIVILGHLSDSTMISEFNIASERISVTRIGLMSISVARIGAMRISVAGIDIMRISLATMNLMRISAARIDARIDALRTSVAQM